MSNLLPIRPAPSVSLPTSISSPNSLLPSPSSLPLLLPPRSHNFSAPLTFPGRTTCWPAILTDLPVARSRPGASGPSLSLLRFSSLRVGTRGERSGWNGQDDEDAVSSLGGSLSGVGLRRSLLVATVAAEADDEDDAGSFGSGLSGQGVWPVAEDNDVAMGSFSGSVSGVGLRRSLCAAVVVAVVVSDDGEDDGSLRASWVNTSGRDIRRRRR